MSMLFMFLLQDIIFAIYISYRVYKSFFTKYKPYIVMPIIIIIIDSFILIMVLRKIINTTIPDIFIFISNSILAISIYLFMLYIMTDIIRLIFKFIHKPFISHRMQGMSVLIITIIVCLLGYINSHTTKIKEYNITLNKNVYIPFKIVALADIHIGSDMSSNRLHKEIEYINELKPDIVFIVGDIIDNNIDDFTDEHIKQFQKLNSPLGTYVVFGNHEYYSGSSEDIIHLFNKAGFKTLVDDVAYIPKNDFYIIGRDSLRHNNDNGSKRKNILTLYDEVEDKTKPVIILDHIPKSSADGKKINADIQISGHTHDGQFFPVNLIVKKMYELTHGMINYNGFHFFVTSGLGLWGPPIRVGTDSEILVINVNGK